MRKRSALTDGDKRRALVIILINTFLMWGGFFMVIPLIAVYFVDSLGWAAASVGLILAVRQFLQQGLMIVGGMLADRLGSKGLMTAGIFLRAIGFAGMAWADTFSLLLLTSIIAALGGALFEAPRSAAIAALTDEHNRNRFYSLAGMVGGLGMTFGILAGAILMRFDFSVVALIAGACYLLPLLLTLGLLPPIKVSEERKDLLYGVTLALRDRPFMTFLVLMMGYWLMAVQLSISLPLVATAIGGTTAAVSWIYMLNAGMTILLQYPLVRFVERRLAPLPTLMLGTAVMAVGLASVALMSSMGGLLLAVALFSLGGILALPNQQTVTANLAKPVAYGSYFGVSGLALAIGGGLGNYLGGWLYGVSTGLNLPALPWLIFCFVGLMTLFGLQLLQQKEVRRSAQAKVGAGVR